MSVAKCPYCSSKAGLLAFGLPGCQTWQVMCKNCQAAGPVVAIQSLAVWAWNAHARPIEMTDRQRADAMLEAKEAD